GTSHKNWFDNQLAINRGTLSKHYYFYRLINLIPIVASIARPNILRTALPDNKSFPVENLKE
ncbi:hypothetical protein, partial [Nostoc sp.]